MHTRRLDPSTDLAQVNERSLVVPTREQSLGLTAAGIPATYPAALLSAWPEEAAAYLSDPANGPTVLILGPGLEPEYGKLRALLRRLRIPWREARP